MSSRFPADYCFTASLRCSEVVARWCLLWGHESILPTTPVSCMEVVRHAWSGCSRLPGGNYGVCCGMQSSRNRVGSLSSVYSGSFPEVCYLTLLRRAAASHRSHPVPHLPACNLPDPDRPVPGGSTAPSSRSPGQRLTAGCHGDWRGQESWDFCVRQVTYIIG